VIVKFHLQVRLSVFGTHVFPKTKYITVQMTRSAKGIVFVDMFLIVVSIFRITSTFSFFTVAHFVIILNC
jgi:hypothetical protein